MIKYLRDEFTDGVGTIGMKNMIAQTRIASSYGYFQALYTTALGWGYDEEAEHLPENLNTFEVLFPLVIQKYSGYLSNQEVNNWNSGFETTIKDKVFSNWNDHKKYPNSTLNNVERFLPQK